MCCYIVQESIRKKTKSLLLVWKIVKRSIKISGREAPHLFAILLVLRALEIMLPLGNSYIYKDIIDLVVQYFQHHILNYRLLYLLFGIRFITLFVQTILLSWDILLSKRQYKETDKEFVHAVNTKLASMNVYHFESPAMQDLLDKVNDNTWRAKEFVDQISFTFQSIIQIVASIFVVVFVAPILIPLIILLSLPSFFVDMRFSKIAWGIWDAKSELRKRYWYSHNILRRPDASKEIQLFSMGNKFVNDAYDVQKEFTASDAQIAQKTMLVNIPLMLLSNLGTVGVEVYVVLRAITGAISIGSLSYITNIMYQLNQGIYGLLRNFSKLYENALYIESVFTLLDTKNVILEREDPVVLDPTKPHTVEMRNITFTYPGAKTKTFDNFSLTLNPGEKIALVGENGAGKTTLIKLLVRFYDVDEGGIYIDGINIKDVDLASWYRCIGIIFQDYMRYEMSVKENIQAGKMHDIQEGLEQIVDAASKASADTFIEKYENEYEQMLGTIFTGAINPSGGQWQKVALARGFLRDASILILDEPTSAIDAKAEYEIFQKVESLQQDKSVIIVSHRFSTVRNAQKIYVIESGKIIESGTHENLMQLGGTYARLFQLQAKGYQ